MSMDLETTIDLRLNRASQCLCRQLLRSMAMVLSFPCKSFSGGIRQE